MITREIKAERIRLGISQGQMAERLGIARATYQQKENGVLPFTESQKFKLAEILHFDIYQMNDFLFDGKLPLDGINAKR